MEGGDDVEMCDVVIGAYEKSCDTGLYVILGDKMDSFQGGANADT